MRKLILLLSVWSILLVSSAWAQDEKAKVSSGDSTPDFLMNKFHNLCQVSLLLNLLALKVYFLYQYNQSSLAYPKYDYLML